jgi:hypothetical protein
MTNFYGILPPKSQLIEDEIEYELNTNDLKVGDVS